MPDRSAVLLALFIVAVVGTGPSTPAMAQTTLTYAKVSADGNPAHIATRYGPLMKALGESVGVPVSFQTRASYDELSRAMKKGQFDIVSAGPLIFLDHASRYEPIARPIRRGKTSYRGIFLVAAGTTYKTLNDLKGRRLGFANQQSTSGYLLPALMLGEAGFDLERDFKSRMTFYSGDHTAVVRAVTDGKIDAGAVYDDARAAAYGNDATARAKTRILLATPEIPNAPVMVRKGMSPALRARVEQFFTGCANRPDAHELFDQVDERLSGWVQTSAADYEVVRRYRSAFSQSDQ